jgi:hypothetical protein
MKTSKTFFVKGWYFVVVFSLLGAFALYAQDDSGAPEANPQGELSLFKEAYESKMTAIESRIDRLEKSLEETKNSPDPLSSGVLKPQIAQLVSAASAALVALLLLALVVLLLLKQLRFYAVVEDAPKSKSGGKFQKEPPSPEESGVASPGISSVELGRISGKLGETELKLGQLVDRVNSQSKDTSGFQNELVSFRTEMAGLKDKLSGIHDAVSLLKTDMDTSREKIARKEQVENDPVAIFNQWAQNPHLPFPQYFTYVTNVKLEFRTKQDFSDTSAETEWIRNTVGEKKYLFPNPNRIDNLSGPIDKLYKVAGTRKAKGTNSVKVISACQIKEGNFIEYQGELLLI